VNVRSKDATKPVRKKGDHSAPPRRDPPPPRRRPVKEAGAAADYDAPRKREDDPEVDSLEELQVRQHGDHAAIDEEDINAADEFELPGADLSAEELTIAVVPKQADEFVCTRCFLVHHRSQLASDAAGQPVCSECAA
jgi:hypothetical protein